MSDRLRYAYRRLAAVVRNRYSKFLQTHDYASSFRNAKVVVIGPNCQFNERDRERMAMADVCVVMNKGRRMAIYPEVARSCRRIAYFHCLDESDLWGGGPLDSAELRRAGFTELFYPLADPRLEHNVERFHTNNHGLLRLRRISPAVYREVECSLGGFRPTSGLAIASSLARVQGCTLYVTGVTFYRKAYMPEYASHLLDLASIKEQMESHGVHHPDREFLEFMRLKSTYGIEVDDQLAAILQAPYVPLFYTAPGDGRMVPAPHLTDTARC